MTFLSGLWHQIERAMLSWHELKMFIEHASIVSSDALHILVGVGIWVIAGLILRRSLASWLPLLVVLAAIVYNEGVDLWVERWPDAGMQYGESAKDFLLTMTVPVVLLIMIRLTPSLFQQRAKRRR
jgi:hypothetical protein